MYRLRHVNLKGSENQMKIGQKLDQSLLWLYIYTNKTSSSYKIILCFGIPRVYKTEKNNTQKINEN